MQSQKEQLRPEAELMLNQRIESQKDDAREDAVRDAKIQRPSSGETPTTDGAESELSGIESKT
jgi:hypothetical protein